MKAKQNKIRFCCEIALAVLTVAVALLFIIEVADIYYSGDEVVFSREIVGERLKILVAPMVIWIVAVIACFVLSVLYPSAEKKKKTSEYERVRRLKKKIPVCDGEEFATAKKELFKYETVRYVLYGVASCFAVATAIVAIVYLSDVGRFRSGKINTDILLLVKNVFPFIIVSFALFISAVIYDALTAKKELKLISVMLVTGKGKPIVSNPLTEKITPIKQTLTKNSEKIIWVTRAVVFVVAVVFIGLGISNGGVRDVLYKAVNICTECIGLG